MADRQVLITERLMADYYPEFKCIADHCHDTCCSGWNITLTKNDYMALRRECRATELKSRFDGAVHRIRSEASTEKEYARFQLKDGHCQFLSEEGLCTLQLECGHQALPEVCRTFPRTFSTVPSGDWEYSCSTGCEAVLELLYQRQDGLGFIQEPLLQQEQKLSTFSIFGIFTDSFGLIRELCIDLLQDRTVSLPDRLLLLGLVLRDMAALPQETDPASIPAWLERKRALVNEEEVRELVRKLPGNQSLYILNNVKQLLRQKGISGRMDELRTCCFQLVKLEQDESTGAFHTNLSGYQAAEKEFVKANGDLEYLFENIMVNTFFHCKYPIVGGMQDIWGNYVNFCNIYSSLRFLSVCCTQEGGLPQLFHVLAVASRWLLHSGQTQKSLTTELLQQGNVGLADMAVLVRG